MHGVGVGLKGVGVVVIDGVVDGVGLAFLARVPISSSFGERLHPVMSKIAEIQPETLICPLSTIL